MLGLIYKSGYDFNQEDIGSDRSVKDNNRYTAPI